MARLTAAERAKLPDRAFAYVDSRGQRRLPIHDESHVRNALTRFDQVKYESPEAKEEARDRLLKAAKRHGIMPIGFITRQLQSGTRHQVAELSDTPDLPEGMITMVFTDIEGSTALLRALEGDYESLLDAVRHIIRRSVLAAGGVEVEARADETFSIFEHAPSALDAAVTFQRIIRTTSFPGEKEVRVRVGLHTGKARLTSNGYIGLAIHKAARVCAAAHGGQIVASHETRKAVGDAVPTGVGQHGLGKYHLSGLNGSHHLYQIVADGLLADFPSLRT